LAFGTITSLDISPLNSNRIIAGTDDGNVWISTDGGSNWDQIAGNNKLPNRWVTSVRFSPLQEDAIYVTYSGFRFDEDEGHLYYSEDLGVNWLNRSESLPDLPINTIIIDQAIEDRLFLATDLGVFYSLDNGISWDKLGVDLPNVPVTDLDISVDSDFLLAATYGRSMYSYDLSLETSISSLDETDITIFPNPTADQLTILHAFAKAGLSIFNVDGVQVFKTNIACRSTKCEDVVSLNGLPSGSYIVFIESEELVRMSTKLIKL